MFELVELQLLRQSLDVITILGKDAKKVANLQQKLESAIAQEQSKAQELDTLIKSKAK
jgi:hypothetical protein